MARKRIPDTTLIEFADEHLLYEAQMLRGLGEKLVNGDHRDDPITEYGVLESFTVHCRLILDFLYIDEPKWSDDAAAIDYFDDDTWQRARPEMSDRLATVNRRVGKEIAHLSYKRLEVRADEKGWIVVSIGLELAGTFGHWAGLVPEHRPPADWLKRFDKLAGVLRDPEWQKYVIRPHDVPTQVLGPLAGAS